MNMDIRIADLEFQLAAAVKLARGIRDSIGAEFETYCDVRAAGQEYPFQMTRLNEWRAGLDELLLELEL